MIPFPPLPAVVLLPFVAVFGLALDQVLFAVVIGALDVAVAFWVLGRLGVRPAVRVTADPLRRRGDGPLVRGVDRHRPGTSPTSSRSAWRWAPSAWPWMARGKTKGEAD